MKSLFLTFSLSLVLTLGFSGLALGSGLPAQIKTPKAVTFFTNNALVEVEEKASATIMPDGKAAFIISLPADANPQSLFLKIDGKASASIQSLANLPQYEAELSYKPEEEQNPIRKEFLENFIRDRKNYLGHENKVKFLNDRMELWTVGTKLLESKLPSSEEIKNLDTGMQETLLELYNELSEETLLMQEAHDKMARSQKILENFDESNKSVLFAAKAENLKQGTLTYSYILNNTGLSPRYRVNAKPADKKLSIEQNLELQQKSGIDWHGVDVSVALMSKDFSPSPQNLQPWILDYAKSPNKAFAESSRMALSANMKMADAAPMAAQAPEYFEMATFKQWKLGKCDILNNVATKIALGSDEYEADFYYTIRPSQSTKGYLTAQVKYPEGLNLPESWSDVFVEDTYIGADRLSYQGGENLIYLGSDPQVVVTKKEIKSQRGEQGFFTKEQTRLWHWDIIVDNKHSWPIDLLVQEAQPVSRDESIIAKIDSKPEAESVSPEGPDYPEALKLYVWKKKGLEAGKSFFINYKINVEAAVGKSLSSKK